MLLVGIVGVLAVIYPPTYLQALVVFSSSAGAASFVTPALMTCYWRRATAKGAFAAMMCGFATYLGLFSLGWLQVWAETAASSSSFATQILNVIGRDPMIGIASAFRPYFLLGVDPILWGLMASAVAGVVVSLVTKPPPEELVSQLFDAPTNSSH